MSGTIQDAIQGLGSNNLRNSFLFVEREIGLQLIYYIFFGNKERGERENHRESFIFKHSLGFIGFFKEEKIKVESVLHHFKGDKNVALF